VSCFGGSIYPGYRDEISDGIVLANQATGFWAWNYFRSTSIIDGSYGCWPFTLVEVFACNRYLMPDSWVQGKYTDGNGQQWNMSSTLFPTPNLLDIWSAKLNATQCLLYGHVGVERQTSAFKVSCDLTEEELPSYLTINQTWRWQTIVTNGVAGDVTMTPVASLRQRLVFDASNNLTSALDTNGPFGPTPVVTITVAP
jgi:hypothetical protein